MAALTVGDRMTSLSPHVLQQHFWTIARGKSWRRLRALAAVIRWLW